uniref:L,D-transpeptidase family protein n=1 Tax=uncultured Nocardioides sp. TaxID=198441 RepID=UPI00260C868E
EDYNLMVRAPYEWGHERLRRGDRLYALVILTDWNWPYAVKGRGSAIFLHQQRRKGFPTEGCIAFRRDHLQRIARLIALRFSRFCRSPNTATSPSRRTSGRGRAASTCPC